MPLVKILASFATTTSHPQRKSPAKWRSLQSHEDGLLILMFTLNLLDSPACVHRCLRQSYRVISSRPIELRSLTYGPSSCRISTAHVFPPRTVRLLKGSSRTGYYLQSWPNSTQVKTTWINDSCAVKLVSSTRRFLSSARKLVPQKVACVASRTL